MSNFRKFISMSAVAVLAGTNLLAPLSYVDAATAWASLADADFKRNPLEFQMPDHNVSLYAVTAPNTYYVAFSGNGSTTGSMLNQLFEYDEEKALSEMEFTKTGYTPSGWKDGSGTSYEDKQIVKNLTDVDSGTVNMYAQWTANKYNISYDLNKGAGTSTPISGADHPTEVEYDSGFTVSNPSREGYTFSGWDISNMDSEQHIVGGITTSETTTGGVKGTAFENLRATSGTVEFLAQWTANLIRYKVKHSLQDLEGTNYVQTGEIESFSGEADSVQTPSVKTFAGFEPDTATTPTGAAIGTVDDHMTFEYKYNRLSYDLTLIAGTGVASVKGTGTVNTAGVTTNTTATGSFKYEEPIEVSYVLEDGYENARWSGYSDTASSFNMPVEGATKEAYATAITYTVTGNYHGGTGATPNVNEYVTTYTVESGAFSLPSTLTRDHSIFSGWTGEGITTPTKEVVVGPNATGNRVYNAVWDCVAGYNLGTNECIPNTDTEYRVEHYQRQLGGNYELEETDYPHGITDTEAVWTGKNYEGFSGGYLKEKEQNINGSKDTVVKVYYDRNSYNYSTPTTTGITIDVGAPTIDGTGTKITYGDTVTLTPNVQSGYEFSGWVVSGGDVTVTNNRFIMPAGDVTITAELTKTTYTISYDLHSGSVSGTNLTSYNVETETFELTNPTREHSTFVGWSGTAISGTSGTVTIAKGSVGNRSYEAIWGCEGGYHADGDSCVANEYTISVNYNDSDQTNTGITVTYGSFNTIPNPSKSGYIFSGWTITGMSGDVTHYIGSYTDITTATSASGVMGDKFMNLTTDENGTVTFTAVWEADEVTYTVHHMIEGLDVDTYSQTGEVEVISGTSDETVIFTNLKNTYVGFTYSGGNLSGGTTWPNEVKTETTIDRHGTTHIYLYYDRNKHTVTLSGDVHVESLSWEGAREFEYGAEVRVTATPKTGYHFKEWQPTLNPTSGS